MMNIFLFVIGMLTTAIISMGATLLLGGSVLLALAMGGVTLVTAQLLYLVLLLSTAWLSRSKKEKDWAKHREQSRTKA
ncbi:hypothetical protein [Sulfitobacter dubius]|uniref:hypothetical protein n=1 Tax=Sulfitobacter dubius TaxID=218673 RepID=UPI0008E56300|nr:hypothetical protein [Sulfitobacter dubius]SFH11009.1 hypothetical protein SAMN04488039_103121 [Sulfitobacter dubius]